jgi:hypothetical protein
MRKPGYYVPASDPKEDISLVLKFGDGKLSHFIVLHCAVRKLENTERKKDSCRFAASFTNSSFQNTNSSFQNINTMTTSI